MILGFRDRWLEDFFLLDLASRKIPSELDKRLFRKLQLLDDATSDSDLRVPPSNHFEKLRGKLAGLALHSGQQPVAADLPLEWQPRRGNRGLS